MRTSLPEPSGTSFRASLRSPETLVRLSADRLYSGGEILDAMLLRGEVHRFDSYCRQKAIRTGSLHHQPGKKLFINFQPSSIYDPAHCLRSTLHALSQTQLTPEDVVFEVVETEHVRDVAHLRRIADYYRDRGFGFALDDVGAGINTTDMVYAVRPDYVKIDKSLTRSADDAELQKALDAIVGCARDLGCAMIGEGVESATIAEWLLRRGVCLQQGWGTATYASHGARLHGLRCTGTTLFRQPVCSSEAKSKPVVGRDCRPWHQTPHGFRTPGHRPANRYCRGTSVLRRGFQGYRPTVPETETTLFVL